MKILVAGIGNVFFGDDGFGPAVVAALGARPWPAHVEIADYGIRGMDLAFALTSGLDAAILVDAVARGGAPGTVYAIAPAAPSAAPSLDTHAMDPARVLALAASIGALPRIVRLVGCEPERLAGDDGDVAVGLSASVAGAIAAAAALVGEQVAQLTHELERACTS